MRPALRLRELNCTSSSWTHSSHEASSCDLQLFTIYFYYLWKWTNLLCSGLCCIYIEVSQGQRMIFQTWFYICQLSRFYIHLIFACCFMCFNLFFFFFCFFHSVTNAEPVVFLSFWPLFSLSACWIFPNVDRALNCACSQTWFTCLLKSVLKWNNSVSCWLRFNPNLLCCFHESMLWCRQVTQICFQNEGGNS